MAYIDIPDMNILLQGKYLGQKAYRFLTVSGISLTSLVLRQRINLAIMIVAHVLSLAFAFPSRTIYFGDQLQVQLTPDH